jgi:hypothetical protein
LFFGKTHCTDERFYGTISAKHTYLQSFSGNIKEFMQYPLSRDEHAAMMRYLTGIRKQLQDVSDLFTARYGKNSSIAEIAAKSLVSSTLLEHELSILEADPDAPLDSSVEMVSTSY